MNLGPYRLLAQLGAGFDGVAYRAIDTRDERPVEVRVLSGVRGNPNRWAAAARRLRLAAQLEHPSQRRIRDLALEQSSPYVALDEGHGKWLGDQLKGALPVSPASALATIHELTDVLTEAHRLGLAHGGLCPRSVLVNAAPPSPAETSAFMPVAAATMTQQMLTLDFTGLDIYTASATTTFADVDASCRASGSRTALLVDPGADVFAVAALLGWILSGRALGNGADDVERVVADLDSMPKIVGIAFGDLLREMLACDPGDRPSMAVVHHRLGRVREALDTSRALAVTNEFSIDGGIVAVTPASDESLGRTHLGRFRLLDKLGQGGMGEVYRAEDSIDGTIVAIKVLRSDWAKNANALRRFHKEARLLAEVNNPHVTNLLEFNEDEGVHYLAIEFVAGRSLAGILKERGRLDESTSLAVMADVARALVDAHERGIVHRDIKPDNILIADCGSGIADWKTKLSDFGLARHVEQTESMNMTQTGAILGTPLYMSPEQCNNGKVDPRSDVYSMGATLFHLLAGRPPFTGDTPLGIILAHANDPPPLLRQVNPAVSEMVSQVVNKSLAKSPEARYANAAVMLAELERLLRGEPTSIGVHPQLPSHNPKHILEYDFVWELESPPDRLWPHVSNTERLNRAIGLAAPVFSSEPAPEGGSHRFARISTFGLTVAWREHPFEWIEARRMGVLREFKNGPFKWFVSVVELQPRRGGGTTLAHRVRVEPRGLLGRTACAIEIGFRARKSLERVYRRIDAAVSGKLGPEAWVDAFENPTMLSGSRRRKLDALVARLVERGVDPEVADRLGEYLANAPAQEVARIRPLALARRLSLPGDAVVNACLHGAREGLLVLLWDILCPVCRIPSQVHETLRELRSHGRCEACNLDYELDFANSVEVIFRAHPEVRDTELGVFCIGGPVHSPHVAAQARIQAAERIELDLALGEGSYQLRGPQLPYALDFRVEANAAAGRWDLSLSRGATAPVARRLHAGAQLLALTNDYKTEVIVRVERTAPRDDALTAGRAAALALFRELFPSEVLAPGRLISIATVTLLVTELDEIEALYAKVGDARAFALLHEHVRQATEAVTREAGAVVKAVGNGVLAAFAEPAAAVRAALALPAAVTAPDGTRLRVRAAVHRGAAMAATINDHLDYFGTTVTAALRLPNAVRGGELALSAAIAADPQVAALLEGRGKRPEVVDVRSSGLDPRSSTAEMVHWVALEVRPQTKPFPVIENSAVSG
jgi:serine/threonine protein kinase/class 3 adenylate cyclase